MSRPTLPAMGTLGEFVRERRGELHLDLKAVAARADLSEGAISRIERGERINLRASTAMSLAVALEVDLNEIMRFLTDKTSPPINPAAVPA